MVNVQKEGQVMKKVVNGWKKVSSSHFLKKILRFLAEGDYFCKSID
jgi:hypothetical protein